MALKAGDSCASRIETDITAENRSRSPRSATTDWRISPITISISNCHASLALAWKLESDASDLLYSSCATALGMHHAVTPPLSCPLISPRVSHVFG
jgi:hypothetical protein